MGRVPFRYMIDQLSRSDARADGEDTVSIDASSQVTEYPRHTPDHHDDADTQTLSASEDLASALDVKQVLLLHFDFFLIYFFLIITIFIYYI